MGLSLVEGRGVALMMLNGLISTTMLVGGKLLKDVEWPFFRMMAIGGLPSMLLIAAGGIIKSAPLPAGSQVKWILLCGFLRSMTFIALIVAVRLGASPGDVSALSSINTVFAALLGRVFLGEKFQWKHAAALSFSLAGAILISQPQFLFGGSSGGNMVWMGQLLGLLSGFTQACMFISARKSSKTSQWIMNFPPAVLSTLVFALLPFTPLMEDFSFGPVIASPWLAAALCSSLSLGLLLGSATGTAAASWCPAAVSATVSVGSRMLCGYAAQVLLFDRRPEMLTLCGAACMLCGVFIMAVGMPSCQGIPAPCTHADDNGVEPSDAHSEASTQQDDNESLASFCASEFGDHATSGRSLRLRHGENVAQTIGAVTAVVSSSA